MLDQILSQNSKNTLSLHVVDQLVKSAKNETLFYLSQAGIMHRLGVPPTANARKFKPIP